MKEIFISYSWQHKDIADKIYDDLSFIGLEIRKDDHKLEYKDKLSSFMKSIRKADYAILIISEAYLKSINCMTEILELQKDEEIWRKVLPVLCEDAKIYDIEDRITYIDYWQKKSESIESVLKNLDPINATSTYNELKSYKTISQEIGTFLSVLKDRMCITPKELFDTFYAPFFKEMKIEPDFSRVIPLIPISYIKDPNIRLLKVKKYIKATRIKNSMTYAILASCYRDLGLFKDAKKTYKKSLEVDQFNYSAWNNLGEIYKWHFNNYNEAKGAYERAIEIQSDLSESRLNLGLLLSDKFDDKEGAKKQYEEILKYDENNPKAHNNLGNLYRFSKIKDYKKAEYHFKIAIKQDNIEAIMNYANYLKTVHKDFKLGNEYYEKARKLDTENVFEEAINVLIKSEKG